MIQILILEVYTIFGSENLGFLARGQTILVWCLSKTENLRALFVGTLDCMDGGSDGR